MKKFTRLNLYLFVMINLILSIGLTSCGTFLSGSIEDIKEEAAIGKLPKQEEYPEDDGVILFDKHETTVDYHNEIIVTEIVHKAILLFRNIEERSKFEIELDYNEELIEIAARTLKPDGTIIELKKEDFYHSKNESDEVFATTNKVIRFALPQVEKGCIIEYKYKTFTTSLFGSNKWYVQNFLPTLKNEYKLYMSKLLFTSARDNGFDLNWNAKPYNINYETKPEFVVLPGNYALTKWVIRDIPPFKPEPKMPPYNNYRSYIQFAPKYWDTWTSVTEDYYKNYFKSQLRITDKIKSKATRLTFGCKSEIEKIKKITEYVQSLRYIAIEMGIGGIKPNYPEVVLDRGYGDCKDKSILLISLLRSLNIDARPVLAETTEEGTIDVTFPMFAFNHMIVWVKTPDDQIYWIDPTSEFTTLGALPWHSSGMKCIVLENDGKPNLFVTPFTGFRENLQDISIITTVNSESETVFDINFTFSGHENSLFRNFFKYITKEKEIKLFKNWLSNEFINSEIDNIHHDKIDSISESYKFGFSLKINNAVQKIGDMYLLNINPLKNLENLSWLTDKERKYPIVNKFPYTEICNIEVKINDPALKIKTLPENFDLQIDDYSYMKSFFSTQEKEASFQENFAAKTKTISEKKYGSIKEFFGKIKTKSSEKIILSKMGS